MVSRPAPPDTIASFRGGLIDAARGLGRPLSGAEADALASHYRLLMDWGRRMNLTGLRDPGAVLRRHFLEPIAAADLLGDGGTLVDLGSGNGFPAIPLRVLHPGLALVLVEASEKKSAFLWAVLRELNLRGARVETRRAGTIDDLSDILPCRYLTCRAVRTDRLFRGGAAPVLERGGRALFFVSPEQAGAMRERPPRGLRWVETRPLQAGPRSVVAVLEPE